MVDAPGHGASDKPHDVESYALPALVGDITAVLDEIGEEKVHFWGFSMGGQYAYGLANYTSERIRSLIIGSSHPYGRRSPNHLSGDDPEALLQGILSRIGVDLATVPTEEYQAMLNNDFHAIAACFRDRDPVDKSLAEFQAPCLLYVGDRDGGLDKVRSCADLLPNARLEVLPGLNHVEAFSRSDMVLPHVEKFLSGT